MFNDVRDRMELIMQERFRMVKSTYIEAIKIAKRKLPAWDDIRLNAMFSYARFYHQNYNNRIMAYCIGQKALNAAQNAVEERLQKLEEMKDIRERDLKNKIGNDRFKDIVGLLKRIRGKIPEAAFNNEETMKMC